MRWRQLRQRGGGCNDYPRLSIKKVIAPESPASPIGENFVNDIESMKVGTLKKACKKLGVHVTGKKADLMQRVRNHFLNTSLESPTSPRQAI